jgi:hypothetical protein
MHTYIHTYIHTYTHTTGHLTSLSEPYVATKGNCMDSPCITHHDSPDDGNSVTKFDQLRDAQTRHACERMAGNYTGIEDGDEIVEGTLLDSMPDPRVVRRQNLVRECMYACMYVFIYVCMYAFSSESLVPL